MSDFYNDIDPFACEWTRQLIKAGHIPDGVVSEQSIKEIRPADVLGRRRCHYFNGVSGWGLALELAGFPEDRSVWTGSAPCFPAGTLVLTAGGYKPIECVANGDRVLTHAGRFMPVTHTGSNVSDCVVVKGQGHHGLVCTPDHPFYVNDGGHIGWAAARDLKGRRWATVAMVPTVALIEPESQQIGCFFDKHLGKYRAKGERNGRSVHIGVFDSLADAKAARKSAVREDRVDVRGADAVEVHSLGFARFLGYWLGDGWVSGDAVYLCGARGDCDLLNSLFAGAKMPGTAYLEKTSSRVKCGSKHLVAWLKDNFGQFSHGKRIPVWMHGMPDDYRAAFLDGYMTADGHTATQKIGGGTIRCFTTASKAIAIGVRVLLNQAGLSASVRVVQNDRVAVIEGRVVTERPSYRVTSYAAARSFRLSGFHGWGLVRSVEPAGVHRVYNLAVEGDESYTADGIVVHNCQPYSAAGKQKGNADERNLWPDLFRLIDACKPSVAFGEQVSSAIRHGWLDGIRADLVGAGYEFGAVVLGAACVGAPHIRQRLYWVASRPVGHAVGDDLGRDAGGAPGPQGGGERGGPLDGHGGEQPRRAGAARGLADAGAVGRDRGPGVEGDRRDAAVGGEAGNHAGHGGFWDAYDLIPCRDNKSRRVERGTFPLASGFPRQLGPLLAVLERMGVDPKLARRAVRNARGHLAKAGRNRVGRLRGYGNAICVPTAAAFVRAFLDSESGVTA